MPKWTPASKPPALDTDVLVVHVPRGDTQPEITVGYLYEHPAATLWYDVKQDDEGRDIELEHVTHWMPLPKLPR